MSLNHTYYIDVLACTCTVRRFVNKAVIEALDHRVSVILEGFCANQLLVQYMSSYAIIYLVYGLAVAVMLEQSCTNYGDLSSVHLCVFIKNLVLIV